MDESDIDLKIRIKEFLSQNAQFRNPEFDPSPYLIEILKEKSADHEAMIEKQDQLIQLENQAHEIIDDVCGEYCDDFIKMLEIPSFYANNLEKLKGNISIVKKKVKQTKALLLNTQKDLQQIHYNCMFNKIIYRKLKDVEMRLYQYEAAFLALKNNQFLLCSMNLPHSEGQSILESTLASRAETLRLRMLSKAIDLVNLFLFFSPKIVLHSSSALLERLSSAEEQKEIIANWSEHQSFYKRYKLFQKTDYISYLETLLNPNQFSRKEGKVALMNDIVKGVINIGRISQITSSLEINGPKQISNIFMLLKYFRFKEGAVADKSYRWFLDRCTEDVEGKNFISAVMCIVGVIFRKSFLLHKICDEYGVGEYGFSSAIIYEQCLKELEKIIIMMYFPKLQDSQNEIIEETGENYLNQQIGLSLSKVNNYISYGQAGLIIRNSLRIIENRVIEIEIKLFNNEKATKSIKGKHVQRLVVFEEKFYQSLHKDIFQTIEDIFGSEGRSFIVESYDSVMGSKPFSKDEDRFMKGYRSDDRKVIKEFVYSLSFLKTLEEYFSINKLEMEKCYKYILCYLVVFYLKLHSHLENSIVIESELMVIEEQRRRDKKLRKKEEEYRAGYYKILPEKDLGPINKIEKSAKKESEGSKISVNSIQAIEKMKIFQKQNKMFFSFSTQFFQYIEQVVNSPKVIDFIDLIRKLEPANYEQNLKPKIIRVWDTLPNSEQEIRQCTTAVLYKLMDFSCIINAKLYRETNNY